MIIFENNWSLLSTSLGCVDLLCHFENCVKIENVNIKSVKTFLFKIALFIEKLKKITFYFYTFNFHTFHTNQSSATQPFGIIHNR